MTTETQYMTKEGREAKEEAELAAAEASHEAQFGTQEVPTATPSTNDGVTDDGTRAPQETPEQAPEVDWEKRYHDLQSFSDKRTNELREQLKAAGVAEEEPDKVAELEAQLAELQAKEATRETDSIVAQAQNAVGAVHPDYVDVINSPEFSEWIKSQPDVYQHAIYDDRPDAQMSINALTLFKVQSGAMTRNSQQRTKEMQDQAAMSVSGGHREAPDVQAKKIWTWAEVQKMNPAEYARNEKAIDEAIMENRIR